MHLGEVVFSTLLLTSLLSTAYSIYGYHELIKLKDHKVLIMPILCSACWFILSIDALLMLGRGMEPEFEGISTITLVVMTLISMNYFIKHYLRDARHREE